MSESTIWLEEVFITPGDEPKPGFEKKLLERGNRHRVVAALALVDNRRLGPALLHET